MAGPPTSGHAIPVVASSSHPSHPVGRLVAEIFAATLFGQVVQELQQIPVQNGVAVYTGPSLPAGRFYAIRLRQVSEPGAIFRSGLLRRLPGSPSPGVPTRAISVVTGGGLFDLTTPGTEGAPERLVQVLRQLPAPLEFVGVRLTGDRDGHYVVALRGRMRVGFVRLPFTYERRWRLVGNTDPARPERPVLAEPVGPPSISGPHVLPFAAVLHQWMKEGVEQQLAAAASVGASLTLASVGFPFDLQTVSVIRLEVFPRLNGGADAAVSLGAGAITGLLPPPTPGAPDPG
jgi:hypothetical protein